MRATLLFSIIFLVGLARAQSVEITGKIESSVDVENIHVINKTAQKFTITNRFGEFTIPVNVNDTLSFSSVQHEAKAIVVSKAIYTSKTVTVLLVEKINKLNLVTVGKVLTGDLNSDIGNVEGSAPINFYNLGIPGYTGKLATQSERRLSEASNLSPAINGGIYGAGGSMSILPIINAITGRTKMLKKRVEHERNEALITKTREKFSESLFNINPLDEAYRTDFFYFCEMDDNFYETCTTKPDLEVLEFLKTKLKQYKINQKADD
ncbi:hypothetical protein [Jejuia pallidilutea]|uniref:Carboxypeptidase-like protein n=1 Tax=Jejuia pallidilutea TaxID=504487 RepID=A0A090WA14_9FLAO|nr:hypothetical protein [Jejuia pallidilutea]GAL68927.1 hypothetical protein JCM19301_2946 [Jejuia pallidilutea]GAL73003.1 hypothetical protein JCM19302_280 [Jejuia pallidilutea]GAL91050.1 hypothetical protein JCM19538_2664 [Jejuia pallidilutea]